MRTLHHYDERGLLKPAEIDHLTGYRFYSAEQLPRLNRMDSAGTLFVCTASTTSTAAAKWKKLSATAV